MLIQKNIWIDFISMMQQIYQYIELRIYKDCFGIEFLKKLSKFEVRQPFGCTALSISFENTQDDSLNCLAYLNC